MGTGNLKKEWTTSYLFAESMGYVDGLYEDFLNDPNSVSKDWRESFYALPKIQGYINEISHRDIRRYFFHNSSKKSIKILMNDIKQIGVNHLINAYRVYGHLSAKLDPLNMIKRFLIPNLQLSYHGLFESELNQSFFVDKYFVKKQMILSEIYQVLRDTYCGSIGIEYMHIAYSEQVLWFQKKLESIQGKPIFDTDMKLKILNELIAADGLERYLGMRYVGQKRFSLEGGDVLIPMLKEIVRRAGEEGCKEILIGMAHRGRLNVLINILGKAPDLLFQEFEGKFNNDRTGDVKYHLGYSSNLRTKTGNIVHLVLAFNPSHLEIIGSVIQGSARSCLRRRNNLKNKNLVIPVVIHGDAAFSGQGVVMETFNFSQTRGYSTGGTIHIIINNQIGFTTSNPLNIRSNLYCSDIAKMVQVPVIHVNANDPESVVFATQIAFEFRMKFKCDIVIDLVCYRRHGHNEADEPSITQPLMYKKIKSMKPLREYYSDHLINAGVITQDKVNEKIEAYHNKLDKGEALFKNVNVYYEGKISVDWCSYTYTKWTDKIDTFVSKSILQNLSNKLHQLPEGFEPHPVVKRLILERKKITAGELPMNWGYAETMSYATLLNEGYSVRLSGQDSSRGTFSHRHAILHDFKTGETITPLKKIANLNSSFVVIDSVLSEEAVLAFEYGFAASEPNSLVIWEAQFGDFANGAQVVIDQFISSGEQKWGRLCGLVMMLPHGYEGQGPEHSSARLERYMQLCAQQNIQVCTPTTPAQIFHLLRRQILRKFCKPLIIMTPKSLLRHKVAVSSLQELTIGGFQNVIPEIDEHDATGIKQVVLCCGKVYYDLLQKRRKDSLYHIVIIRIEQLYPFPKKELIQKLEKYLYAKKIVWCQEEPKNQGAWFSSQHNIRDCLYKDQSLHYIGRTFSAAPASGSLKVHMQQQKNLVDKALMCKN